MPPRISPPSANSRTSPSVSTKGVVVTADDDEDISKLLEKSSSSRIAAMAERRVARGLETQQQLAQAQQDLKKLKNQLTSLEKEKSHLLNELIETKKVADDATLRLNVSLSAQKQAEDGWELEKLRSNEIERASIESAQKRDQAWQLELEAVQKQHALDVEALSSVEQELIKVCEDMFLTIKAKDEALKDAEDARRVADDNRKRVNDLSTELESLKKFLGSSSINRNWELGAKKTVVSNIQENPVVESQKHKFEREEDMAAQLPENEETEIPIANLLSESRKRIEMLELELEKAKVSEAKSCESLVYQMKQLEESKISLEEANFEIASLHESIRSLEASVHLILHAQLGMHSVGHDPSPLLLFASNQLDANTETEDPKATLKRIEGKFQALLDGARREIDRAKEAAEKWRLEIEESQDAWNGKEAGFVQYMKISEEERDSAKEEIGILIESLMKAEETAKKARDETSKLQDLLKQAVNEATTARESSETARAENCQLKDDLSYMGSKFQSITQENEQLKINEAAALEQVKKAEETVKKERHETSKLRDLLRQAINEAAIARESAEIARTENCQLKDNLSSMGSKFQSIIQENELLKINQAAALEQVKMPRNSPSVSSRKELGTSKKLNELMEEPTAKLPAEQSREQQNLDAKLEIPRIMNGSKDDDKPGILKGLTFDMVKGKDKFSNSFSSTTNRKALSSVSGDRDMWSMDDFDGSHFDNMESDKSSGSRQKKKKTLLHRFGSLLKKNQLRC